MSLLLNLLFEQIANSDAYFVAKFGFDTEGNDTRKVCPVSAYRSPRFTEDPLPLPRLALDPASGPLHGMRQKELRRGRKRERAVVDRLPSPEE